jgi:hypothetical protein
MHCGKGRVHCCFRATCSITISRRHASRGLRTQMKNGVAAVEPGLEPDERDAVVVSPRDRRWTRSALLPD